MTRTWLFPSRQVLPRPVGNVEAQAAAWFDQMRGPAVPEAVREAFYQWHDRDPRHAAAYAHVKRAANRALALSRHPAFMALESSTLTAMVATAGRQRRRAIRLRRAALAASIMLVLAGGALLTNGSWDELRYLGERARYAASGQTLYRTQIGERLTVGLSDGSTMTLNTHSRAVVHFRRGERGVTLLDGQALFDVARNPKQPFVVTAADRRVTALGTMFDVRVSERDVAVTLLEGRVAVDAASEAVSAAAPLRTELAPGEQFVAARDPIATETLPMVRQVDVERTLGWRSGQILFDDDPLQEVIAEVNRYSRRQVMLADPSLAGLRISGAFNSANPAAFVDMLTASYLPLRIVEVDRERIVLGQREP